MTVYPNPVVDAALVAHGAAANPHPQYATAAVISSAIAVHLATAPHLDEDEAAAAAPVQSVAGRTGAVVLSATDVDGLSLLATADAGAGLTLAGGVLTATAPDLAPYATLSGPVTHTGAHTFASGGAAPAIAVLVSPSDPGDAIRFTDKDGRTGRINRRGAFIAAGAAESEGGVELDLSVAGYANLGGVRVNGSDAVGNHFLRNNGIGLSMADSFESKHVRRTAARLIETLVVTGAGHLPRLTYWGQAGTATDREIGGLNLDWADATDAIRRGSLGLAVYSQSTAQTGVGVEAHPDGVRVALWDQLPAARPALTYSRSAESAAEAQLRAALVALGVSDQTTT